MKQINEIKLGDFFSIASETYIRLSYNRSTRKYTARKLVNDKIYEFSKRIYVNGFSAKENEQIRFSL